MTRGQAALEYLVTYGWGFLAVLIVASSLAYFGFLNPAKYLPSRCDFGEQLECSDYRLEDNAAAGYNGCVLLQLQNNFGDGIRIHGIKTIGDTGLLAQGDTDCSSTSGQVGTYVIVVQGNLSPVLKVLVDSSDQYVNLVEGNRQSVKLIVTFSRDLVGAPLHNVTGEVFATAVIP